MRLRGFLIILLIALGVIFYLQFGRVRGGKSTVEMEIDQAAAAKVGATSSTLDALAREIISASAESGLPRELDELRRMRPQFYVPFDAWGKPVKYELVSDSSFKLTSAGPDGVLGTADDISREY